MSTPIIECKKISKKFGPESFPLRSIDLVAQENELIMLMGPSGSGKTTLISIIGGILQQTDGDCIVLGKAINSLPEKEKIIFRGQNLGYMFQYFNLVPTLNAIENAAIPLILNGHKRTEAFEQASQLLLTLGLDKQRFYMPNDLSGGEQQRVSLARSCIHKPKIILCDEPTSFLDHERGTQIMHLMQKIKNETRCTLIMVTHDVRILEFADRILEIDDGNIRTKTNGPKPQSSDLKSPDLTK
jgi:putative ABC transport system ATP-binding protein